LGRTVDGLEWTVDHTDDVRLTPNAAFDHWALRVRGKALSEHSKVAFLGEVLAAKLQDVEVPVSYDASNRRFKVVGEACVGIVRGLIEDPPVIQLRVPTSSDGDVKRDLLKGFWCCFEDLPALEHDYFHSGREASALGEVWIIYLHPPVLSVLPFVVLCQFRKL